MSYYNLDGFFMNYRDSNQPSLWLTSFALQTLWNTRNPYWEYECYVPEDLLNNVALWITKQQNQTTGAFNDVGPLFDLKMKVRNRSW